MLTGCLPFKGDNEQAVLYSILKEKPEPITGVESDISKSIEQVIYRTLEKEPEKRYQKIDALLDDLKSISEGIVPEEIKDRLRIEKLRKRAILYAGAVGLVIVIAVLALTLFNGRAEAIDSIAVLPLENLTGDTEKDYFVDVATEELIGQLGQISGFRRVISRTSAMKYKRRDKTLPEIARELNVDCIVEGSVQQAGDRVRIQVRLIDALPEEQHLWGQTYERAMSDVLVMYDEQLAIHRKILAYDAELTAALEDGFEKARHKGAYRAVADLLAERYGKPDNYAPALNISNTYLDAGEYDLAIDWLEKAYEVHSPNLPYIGMPYYDPLRSDPRFLDLLRKMNLPVGKLEQ